MENEIKRVLDMVESGKLTADEASKLIAAMKSKSPRGREFHGLIIGKTTCGSGEHEIDCCMSHDEEISEI